MNELKEFAIFYVNEHDRLSKEEKKLFYNFIKESSVEQVIYLLKTGKMEQNLNETSVVSKYGALGIKIIKPNKILPTGAAVFGGTVSGMTALAAGTFMAAVIANAAYKLYKDEINKYGKQCNHIKHNTPQRRECEINAKIKATEARLNLLTGSLNKACNQSKDPEKCQSSIKKKINKTKIKLQKLKEK